MLHIIHRPQPTWFSEDVINTRVFHGDSLGLMILLLSIHVTSDFIKCLSSGDFGFHCYRFAIGIIEQWEVMNINHHKVIITRMMSKKIVA